MKTFIQPAIVTLLLLLSACSHSKKATETVDRKNELKSLETDASNKKLFQREWTLVAVSGVSKEELAQMQDRPTLNVMETISGFGGCNRLMGGTYVLKGNEIFISNIASTKKMCVGVGQKVEDSLLAVLNNVKTYKMEAVRLQLFTSDNRSAEFIALDKE